jgi:hypothetical protein
VDAAHSANTLQSLKRTLGHELFQTETSAVRHCRREARRFGDAAPSRAMLAVAEHASSVLEELPALAAQHGMPVSRSGAAVGALFSEVRERLADHFIDAERSYRGTLLGMRHGEDVVRMLRHVAEASSDATLVAFCDAWLGAREPLVEQAAQQLAWFADHSAQATQLARPLPLVGRLRKA